MPTLRADIQAHILHQSHHWHLELLEHVDRLARINQRHILWGRDNHRAIQHFLLPERELHIPSPGRQINDQDIKLAPVHIRKHLLHRAHKHRPAPDNSLLLVHHQTKRHHLKAMRLRRHDAPVWRLTWPPRHTEHSRLARPVKIRIQYPDTLPSSRQRHSKVHTYSRFTNAAFARAHSNHPRHTLGADVFTFGVWVATNA